MKIEEIKEVYETLDNRVRDCYDKLSSAIPKSDSEHNEILERWKFHLGMKRDFCVGRFEKLIQFAIVAARCQHYDASLKQALKSLEELDVLWRDEFYLSLLDRDCAHRGSGI